MRLKIMFFVSICLIVCSMGCGARQESMNGPEVADLTDGSDHSQQLERDLQQNQNGISMLGAEYDLLHPLPDPGEATPKNESTPPPSPSPSQPVPKRNQSQESGGRDSSSVHKELTIAELRKKYPTFFKLNGPRNVSAVSLTFDDAPDDRFTAQVLDVLKKYGVQATFFVVGNRAEKHPDVIQRMVKEGHIIANHSYDHPNALKISNKSFRNQILKTERILKNLTGKTIALYRPPYGNVNEEQINWLASQNYHMVNWNVDSLDWKGIDAEQVIANVFKDVGKGSIILQHSAGGVGSDLSGTVEALPRIIERLQASGLSIVSLSELLGIPHYKD